MKITERQIELSARNMQQVLFVPKAHQLLFTLNRSNIDSVALLT